MMAVVMMMWVLGEQTPSSGKDAFLANKCNRCHAVSSHEIEATARSASMHGPDLGADSTEHDADWLKGYIERREELDGKMHRSRYAGTSEDLDVIVEWLVEIQAE